MPVEHRRTLGEGASPLEHSAADPRLLLKRDDRNPTGSHKDRAAAYQLAAAAARGDRAVTISSSGNAAIATSRYAALHGMPAVVFVHPATDPAKLASIDGGTTTLIVTERAINGAKHLARELRIPNLRPSTNDEALVGYASLGEELAIELPEEIDTVVIFATSGASAIAVADALARTRPRVQVHIVQGEGNAALVDPDSQVTDQSAHGAAAGRLGVRRSRRGRELRAAMEATGGAGHVATAADVAAARELLVADGIDVSDESAANIAVARRLADAGRHVCCVISGAPAGSTGVPPRRIEVADEHEALAAVRSLLDA
ncbi:MAG: threonine synthase [Thermoleophilia bacterium]|nr:threonine synthase [Thermoleophilia bacterium]